MYCVITQVGTYVHTHTQQSLMRCSFQFSVQLHPFFVHYQMTSFAIFPFLKTDWRRSCPNSSRYPFLSSSATQFPSGVLCKDNHLFLVLLVGSATGSLKTLIPKPLINNITTPEEKIEEIAEKCLEQRYTQTKGSIFIIPLLLFTSHCLQSFVRYYVYTMPSSNPKQRQQQHVALFIISHRELLT